MIFHKTIVEGVFEIEVEANADDRGLFARTWCSEEFARQGLKPELVQCSVSFNHKRGTLRGLHYQAQPHAETKLVRCTSGAIYDVAVDLRPGSTTYKKWFGVELSAANRKSLYIPEGCAHGFLTLEDNCEIFYQMSEFYHPDLSRGLRWNDPAFAVYWPSDVEVISERDRTYPDFDPALCLC